MKKIIIFCFIILFVITTGYISAENKAETGTLTIIVNGFKNDEGKAMIALCNSEECFKNTEKAVLKEMAVIKNKTAEWIINGLLYGTYSISVYHDKNSNNKLDKNALGVPKEAYGFSNNARGIFGPPDYEDVIFMFDKEEMTVSLRVK